MKNFPFKDGFKRVIEGAKKAVKKESRKDVEKVEKAARRAVLSRLKLIY